MCPDAPCFIILLSQTILLVRGRMLRLNGLMHSSYNKTSKLKTEEDIEFQLQEMKVQCTCL